MGRASLCLGIALLFQLACAGGGDAPQPGPTGPTVRPWTRTFKWAEGRDLHGLTADAEGRVLLRGNDVQPSSGISQAWALSYSASGEPLWKEGGNPGVHLGWTGATSMERLVPASGGAAWVGLLFEEEDNGTYPGLINLRTDGSPAFPAPLALPAPCAPRVILLPLAGDEVLVGSSQYRKDGEFWAWEPWLGRYNFQGNALWGRPEGMGVHVPLASGSFSIMLKIKEGPGGTLWALCITQAATGELGWLVAVFDGQGQLLRTATHSANLRDGDWIVADVFPMPDGGYLIGCSDRETLEQGVSVWMARYDAAGRALWKEGGKEGRRFPTPEAETMAWGFAAMPDGRMVAGGLSVALETSRQRPWIQCLDGEGRNGWGLDGFPTASDGSQVLSGGIFSGPKSDSAGNVYLLGQVELSGPAGDEIWLLKLGPTGRSQWNDGFSIGLRLGTDSFDMARSLVPMTDGGCAVLGLSFLGPDLTDSLWWLSRVSAAGEADLSPLKNLPGPLVPGKGTGTPRVRKGSGGMNSFLATGSSIPAAQRFHARFERR